MITFKQYLIEMAKKKKKKQQTVQDVALNPKRGAEFAMVGAGKSGLMQADRKDFQRKKQRKEGKAEAKKYY